MQKCKKTGLLLRNTPGDRELLDKFETAKQRCQQFVRDKIDATLDRDMEYHRNEKNALNEECAYCWAKDKGVA